MGLMRHSLLPLFIITISRKKLKYEGVVRHMLLPSFSYLEAIIDPNLSPFQSVGLYTVVGIHTMRKEREIQEWFSILTFVCHFGRETAISLKTCYILTFMYIL